MLKAIRKRREAPGLVNLANLEDLQNQLAHRLASLLVGGSGLAMWLSLPQHPFSIQAFALFAGLLGLGVTVLTLVATRPRLTRHLLVWGLTAALLLGMGVFGKPWLPFVGLLLIFVHTMLLWGSELVTAGAIMALAGWLVWRGERAYPLEDLAVALTLGVAVAWIAVNTLYTTLQWTQNMQHRADRLLDEVRNHRADLSRALKSSEIANFLLRRTQRELIVARKQADEARRMKEQFAANISHELRTPLNLILGFSEMMYLSPEVYGNVNWSPILRRDVYQIYRNSRHLVDMIGDILDLSRFEMTEFSLNKELTPLGPLLQEAGTIAADLFRDHTVRFEVDIPPNLPTLEIDRTRIRQVLLNLLNNARRFTTAGVVRFSAHRREKEIVISISDTGPGIPAEKLPHIFDEFFQVDLSLRRSHQGAGLGLAISKRFVQMHGGSIWVESREGEGSTFFFTLPVHSVVLPLPGETDGVVEPSWPEQRLPPVLVVDPDPSVAAMLRRHLDEVEIIPVDRPEQLADAVVLHHPRAVVVNMPPGKTCPPAIRNTLPVPLVECSLPSQAWMADNLSVAASLTKPVLAEQLIEQIRRVGNVEHVLVIDDDRGFAQLVERMLTASGRPFTVRRAYHGGEGLQAMKTHRPDLVLLDLIMPEVDGFQVLAEMRRDTALAGIPVILLTATSFAEDALSQGGSRILVHRAGGLRPVEVIACLRSVLQVLEPHYDERLVPDSVPASAPNR